MSSNSSSEDESTRHGLMVVAVLVVLVVAGVLGLGIKTATSRGAGAAVAPTAAGTPPAGAQQGEFAPPEKLYFAVGSDALPADSDAVLARVADTVRAQNGVSVLISGFHDAAGDPEANADLAKRRALAVRHALEANGVAPDRLVMSRPELTAGGPDDQEARRVELRLR